MKLYVNEAFLEYYLGFFNKRKGDAMYTPEFDINKDGWINIIDILAVVKALNSWYDFV